MLIFYKYPVFLLLFILNFNSVLKSEVINLESILDIAIKKSTASARVTKEMQDANSDALEIETLSNPTAEIDVSTLKKNSSKSLNLLLEQDIRVSHLKSRKLLANEIRKTALIEEKAKKLEIIHSVTKAYTTYWALQEKEKILKEQAKFYLNKKEVIKNSSLEGLIDTTEEKIFDVEILRLKEQLRVLSSLKVEGGNNLLSMAGIKQKVFSVNKPKYISIPSKNKIIKLSLNEETVIGILKSRKKIANAKLKVAEEDSKVPAFSPRAQIQYNPDENSTALFLGLKVALPIWDKNKAVYARAYAEKNMIEKNLNSLNKENFSYLLLRAYEKLLASNTTAENYKNKILPTWHAIADLLDKKFKNGQTSTLEVFQIKEKIINIENESIQAYLNFITSINELESLLGQRIVRFVE
jgi:outer membrane protein TolC